MRRDPTLKPTNPKDRAAVDRLDLSLFPDTAVAYGALAMTEGDLKYGGYNWRIGKVKASVYYAALRRHAAAWFNGEHRDPKTRVKHLANAIACLGILIDATEGGWLVDDRPPRAPVGRLHRALQKDARRLLRLFPGGPDRFTELQSRQPRAKRVKSR